MGLEAKSRFLLCVEPVQMWSSVRLIRRWLMLR